MVTLPVIVSSLIQLAFGSSSIPISPESRAAHEEQLSFRIRRLDVGEKNGWTYLTGAMALQPKPSTALKAALTAALDGKPYDIADLTKLADQASCSRAILKEAVEKPYWQGPWDPAVVVSLPDFAAPLNAARPIAALAITGFGQDRTADFIPDLELLLKLADTSMQCSINLEDWLTAVASHQMLNRMVIQYLCGNHLKPEVMKELAWMLENSQQPLGGIKESLRHTFAGELSTIMRMGGSLEERERLMGQSLGGSTPRPWLRFLLWITFSAPETAPFFNRLAADIVARCDEPFDGLGHPAFAEVRAHEVPKTAWDYLQFNSMGRLMTIIHLRGYENLLRNAAIQLTGREATIAAVALKRWENDHDSQLPQSLEQLIPQYLSRHPVDLVDGKPLRYQPEKRLLYSIGADMIDNIPAMPERPSLHSKEGEMILLIP
ncbi:MAG: hypothetical protein V4675_06375 [Verrucomicrobiota bacterium]